MGCSPCGATIKLQQDGLLWYDGFVALAVNLLWEIWHCRLQKRLSLYQASNCSKREGASARLYWVCPVQGFASRMSRHLTSSANVRSHSVRKTSLVTRPAAADASYERGNQCMSEAVRCEARWLAATLPTHLMAAS